VSSVIKPDDKAFLQLPGSGPDRPLHPGRVDEVSARGYGGWFRLSGASLRAGMEVQLGFRIDGKFALQPVRVESVRPEGDEVRVALEILGDPISADTRQCYRVSALHASVRCTFGGEAGCEVLEVSATGFAVHATRRHELGQMIDVVVHYEGDHAQGRVVVQSATRVSKTRMRYGVHAPERISPGLNLALSRINLAIQRQQLRRRACSDED
jgi:hypothetical protein